MLKKLMLICALAIMVACTDSTSGDAPAVKVKVEKVSAQFLHKDAVYLPGGQALGIEGRLIRYDFVSNDKGAFDRYTFESKKEVMSLEGAIYANLARYGYSRKVRKEQPGFYQVTYTKKSATPLTFIYESQQGDSEVQAITRIRISWKAD